MAIAERPMIALISAASSARMIVSEGLLNLSAANLAKGLNNVKLSANWMAAASDNNEAGSLYEGVEALREFCIDLGISVPVGKDSMSMNSSWIDPRTQEAKEVTAPMSLVVSTFGLVEDISKT